MSKLNDTQSILLSAASQREGLSLYPLPATVTNAGARAKAITALLKACLIEEREAAEAASVHREEGDIRFGLFATDAGLNAIGLGESMGPADAAAVPAPKPPRQTKATLLLTLIEREEGATLAELIDATGWLPHTTRAALTGLRKKGHEITRGKRGEATCYSIGKAA